jgi:hypothetical protein
MSKRSFLIPFSAAIAALTGTAQAATDKSPNTSASLAPTTSSATDLVVRPNPLKEGELLLPVGEDLFKYVLQHGEQGEIYADHRSHYSHSSHSSHSSHYSSR